MDGPGARPRPFAAPLALAACGQLKENESPAKTISTAANGLPVRRPHPGRAACPSPPATFGTTWVSVLIEMQCVTGQEGSSIKGLRTPFNAENPTADLQRCRT